MPWQRANDDWLNSMGLENRRRDYLSRYSAKTRAEPTSCRLPAITRTEYGAITSLAVSLKRRLSVGGCRGSKHMIRKSGHGLSLRETQSFARSACQAYARWRFRRKMIALGFSNLPALSQ